MAKKPTHTHSYQWVPPSDMPREFIKDRIKHGIWRCAIPGCTHWMPKNVVDMMIGRTSLCPVCKQEFVLTKEMVHGHNDHPHCDNCEDRFKGRATAAEIGAQVVPDIDDYMENKIKQRQGEAHVTLIERINELGEKSEDQIEVIEPTIEEPIDPNSIIKENDFQKRFKQFMDS